MSRFLGFKLGVIALLSLVLLIPLAMIRGIVVDRQGQRDRVLTDIANTSSGAQRLTGPLLVVPFRKTVRETKFRAASGEPYEELSEQQGRLYFLPERLELEGRVTIEERSRGIYKARLFHSKNEIGGYFDVPAQYGLADSIADYRFDPAILAVGISDIRGIESSPKLRLNDQELPFAPGSADGLSVGGIHAALPAKDGVAGRRLTFAFSLDLQGTSQWNVTPVGRDTTVHLTADWPHPSFVGEFLPTERQIHPRGFTASWQTNVFATNMGELLNACVRSGACDAFRQRNFGVDFVDPVDQYLKTDRAIKYSLLFIGLSFAGFFLFEVLGGLAVHPVQYGLVGLSLALFYLLLLSLSEHIGFVLAYGLSASASVLLVGFYISHVLRGWKRGAGFTVGLAALYGALYGLLSAEDFALLLGSLLLFGLLAALMILTRKLDWYALAKPVAAGSDVPLP